MSRLFLAGSRYRELYEPFVRRERLDALWLPDNPRVDPRLRGHADLSLFPLDHSRVLLADWLQGTQIPSELQKYGLTALFDEQTQSDTFPEDCGLNALKMGNTLVCSPKATSPTLLRFAERSGWKQLPVRQGYIRCSVCPVTERAAVTADGGIARALEQNGCKVLRITPGHVELPGYPEGFFGGAAVRLEKGHLLLTGCLDQHPDGTAIRRFLEEYGIEVAELRQDALIDTGGAFFMEI